MRINVYEEELTSEVDVVSTTTSENKTFYGVRMFYKSHPDLHHTPTDDDRTAITLWVGDHAMADQLAVSIAHALGRVKGNKGHHRSVTVAERFGCENNPCSFHGDTSKEFKLF